MSNKQISVHIPKSVCPRCGYKMDMATGIDPLACPKEGSVSICGNCGEVLTWNENLLLVSPTEQQLREFNSDPLVREAVRLIRERGRFQ